MQRPLQPSDDALKQELGGYELMVDTLAFSAKAYWTIWGPLGQPMINAVDRWAERQREYLQPLRNESS